jgi:phytoene desaturase
MRKAIVIGSGIAGLAAALRLRKQEFEVEVFETNAHAGGKLHVLKDNGYRFDYGPSLFTMPQLVDELFELFDEKPENHFSYIRKDTVCNYFWEDGTQFSFPANKDAFVDAASDKFNTPKQRIRKYINSNALKYDNTASIFLEKSLHKLGTAFDSKVAKALLKITRYDLLNSLNKVNEKHFDNPKLVQLFNRYATYNGSSPYRTPGIMSMIPHLEMHYGAFLPKGGMHEISQSLYRLAVEKGVKFRFNERVDKIEHINGKATTVVTAENVYPADLIVSNMDIYSTYQHLLSDITPPKHIMKQERSSSALIFYWGLKRSFPELELHNILFSEDYQKEFDHIFEKNDISDDPTVYINITAKDEPKDAPEGCENWFVMVNVPANTGQDWVKLKKAVREAVIAKVNRVLKVDLEDLIQTEQILDPIRIEADTSSHQGSLYGTSSNSKMAAFLRHPNFSSKLKNMYFVGGSVHPGGGIPLCLYSAKITSELIANDR